MKILKSTLKTEVVYDDTLENKYLVKKEWDKTKKTALIIMKNAGNANQIEQDQTTMYVINNLAKLGYGSVSIMNLFPSVINKDNNTSAIENLKFVQAEVPKVDDVIIAVGTGIETNKEAVKRLNMIVAILLDKNANILQIESAKGRRGFHPLYPAVKNSWILVPYNTIMLDKNEVIS